MKCKRFVNKQKIHLLIIIRYGIILLFCESLIALRKIIFYHTHIGTDRSGVTHDVMEAHDPDVVEKPEREDMKNVSNHH